MDTLPALILGLLIGVVPMTIFALGMTAFDRYEKEPLWLMLVVYLWGMSFTAAAAIVLGLFLDYGLFLVTGSESAAEMGTLVLAAPVVEEVVKGAAVLGVLLLFRREFDSLLDGILYGSLVGFGFAATENALYVLAAFAEEGPESGLLVAGIRGLAIAFNHALYTSCTGLGLAGFRIARGRIRYAAPFLGLGAGIAIHAIHNAFMSTGAMLCFLGLLIDWAGVGALFVLMGYLVVREGRVMRRQLQEEVSLGTISGDQYRRAGSILDQMSARWTALTLGSWKRTSRFYDLLGELAFKKDQLAYLGPDREPEAAVAIERLRAQIVVLARHSA